MFNAESFQLMYIHRLCPGIRSRSAPEVSYGLTRDKHTYLNRPITKLTGSYGEGATPCQDLIRKATCFEQSTSIVMCRYNKNRVCRSFYMLEQYVAQQRDVQTLFTLRKNRELCYWVVSRLRYHTDYYFGHHKARLNVWVECFTTYYIITTLWHTITIFVVVQNGQYHRRIHRITIT
jgi:hypothetical protein